MYVSGCDIETTVLPLFNLRRTANVEKSFRERLLAVYNYNLDYLRIQLLLLFQLLLSAGVCNNNMEIVHFGVALSPGYLTYKFRC